MERLEDAFALLQEERFGGCVYLGGRAVEGMLRAVIWKSDPEYATGRKSLVTGHDLHDLLQLIRSLGVLRHAKLPERITHDVRTIARTWRNNMRFVPTAKLKSQWYNQGEIGKRRTLKQLAGEFYDACARTIKQCEGLWQRPG